jgi:3-keto-5-aminohexanoate cleavage enzyme
VRIGRTSRQMRFEARKVISNVRAPGVPASAADVLAEPVVVCRAIGTCVTPEDCKRTVPALYMRSLPPHAEPTAIVTPPPSALPELVLTAAIVGAEVTRAQTPHLPITPEEIGVEAAKCQEAGAAVIHLHVREDDGRSTQSADRFAAAIEQIKKRSDVVVQLTTGGAVGMSIDERADCLRTKPEMATLNCGTLNFGDDVFVNTRPDIRRLAAKIRESGAVAELECYEVGHVEEALRLSAEGVLGGPLHFQFVLGVAGGIGASEANVRFMASMIPEGATASKTTSTSRRASSRRAARRSSRKPRPSRAASIGRSRPPRAPASSSAFAAENTSRRAATAIGSRERLDPGLRLGGRRGTFTACPRPSVGPRARRDPGVRTRR